MTKQSPSLPKDMWKSPAAGAALIILLTVAAYIPAMHAGFIWDDDFYVTANPTLRSLGGLAAIWLKPGATIQYYPLVFTSFWVEHHLWGLHPFGYHLVNILLHAINAVLLWRVLQRLEIPGAWWAAAIFALHPVNVESVAWITERKNTLSGLFYLLAALAWLRYRPLTTSESAREPDWRYYWLALALFACALFSKTVTCSLPAVLMLVIWWKTGRLDKRDGLALAPWFGLGILSGLVTRWMEQRAGAHGAYWELSFVQRCLVAGRALWFYAGKLFWPRQFTFVYPRWEIDARAAWQYTFPLAALVVLAALWLLRSRIGRGPLAAVLCFAGTLVPALGFFDVYPFRYSFVADHFQYLACIGLITLTTSAVTVIGRRITDEGRRFDGTSAAAALLLILGATTWSQAHIYQNEEILWRDTLAKNPDASIAHNNLGIELQNMGRLPEAIEQLEQARRLQPDDAEAHYNLANVLSQAGRAEEAIQQYEQALRLQPDYAKAHNNLGITLIRLGRRTEAMEHWEQAVRFQPDYAEPHCNLGTALAQMGRMPEAMEHWEQAVHLKPDYAEAHCDLGIALAQAGRIPEAITHLELAVRIRPDFTTARNALARLQAGQ